MKEFKPLTIEEIENVWGNSNFGDDLNKRKMDVVKGALLKQAAGYSNGHTAFMIIVELGLITKNGKITSRGKQELWRWFGNGL